MQSPVCISTLKVASLTHLDETCVTTAHIGYTSITISRTSVVICDYCKTFASSRYIDINVDRFGYE